MSLIYINTFMVNCMLYEFYLNNLKKIFNKVTQVAGWPVEDLCCTSSLNAVGVPGKNETL